MEDITNLEFKDKTLDSYEINDTEFIIFNFTDGSSYKMYHEQDCCESVSIDDIVGDMEDLIGNPLLVAEEFSNSSGDEYRGSETYTYYKLRTIKGSVDIKWYGGSNGYYSESVYIQKLR